LIQLNHQERLVQVLTDSPVSAVEAWRNPGVRVLGTDAARFSNDSAGVAPSERRAIYTRRWKKWTGSPMR